MTNPEIENTLLEEDLHGDKHKENTSTWIPLRTENQPQQLHIILVLLKVKFTISVNRSYGFIKEEVKIVRRKETT